MEPGGSAVELGPILQHPVDSEWAPKDSLFAFHVLHTPQGREFVWHLDVNILPLDHHHLSLSRSLYLRPNRLMRSPSLLLWEFSLSIDLESALLSL
jgi:hypothetical protein